MLLGWARVEGYGSASGLELSRSYADGSRITKTYDDFGRSGGFAYSKGGVAACAEQYGYASNGRLSSAAFNHGGEWKTFSYNYLPGPTCCGLSCHSLRTI